MFSELLLELSESWESYRSGKKTNGEHATHKLVVNEIPKILAEWTPNHSKYRFVGSDGKGNILRVPWFATLNLDVTNSATKGYYLVYLLSADLKTLVLEIGFGAEQFEQLHGRGKKFFSTLESAVVNMRINSEHLKQQVLSITKSRTNVKPVILDNSGDFRLRAYEKCAIYSLSYSINALPGDKQLKNDYLEFLLLYEKMSESLLLADVDAYVYESIDDHLPQSEVKLITFEPRIFRKRIADSNGGGSGSSRRYSKKSDKVGKLGEEIVFEFEKKKLIQEGREDLAKRVNWHREDANNRTPGWDITSFSNDGSPLFIEVKSSEGKKISDVELTINEWTQAENNIHNDRYRIYLVSDVFSDPIIEVVINPALSAKNGEFTLSVARYHLLLGVRPE